MLLPPTFTGRWGLYILGMPLGKGALENLGATKGDPRAMWGHGITGTASWGAAVFLTT